MHMPWATIVISTLSSPPPPHPSRPPLSPLLPPSPLPPALDGYAVMCAASLGAVRSVVSIDGPPLSTPTALTWHPEKPDELWLTDSGSDSLTVLNTTSKT